MATVTRTFELSVEAAAELDRRAAQQDRAASDVMNDLLQPVTQSELRREDFTADQWTEIQLGLEDERAGRFVPHEQVEAMLQRYREAR